MEVETAIENAKDWLKTAEVAAGAGKYPQALYSLEMAVEIAFKAVLISIHVEMPKVHDTRKTVRVFLAGNKSIPKSFSERLDDFLVTFETLLKIRSLVGYGLETSAGKNEIKDLAVHFLPKCAQIINECEKAIKP